MNEDQFKIISDKIDFLTRILVLNLIKDLGFKEQVNQLSNLGFKEIEIVKILNSTRNKVHEVMRNKK